MDFRHTDESLHIMKSLAAIKRRAQVGTVMTMTYHEIYIARNNLVGNPRAVKTVQSDAIQFEPHKPDSDGSWLYWPLASKIKITGADSFDVLNPDGSVLMSYVFAD